MDSNLIEFPVRPKICRCGCGEATRGGNFRPGHVNRFRSAIRKRLDAGDHTAVDEARRWGGLEETEILARLEGNREMARVARVHRDYLNWLVGLVERNPDNRWLRLRLATIAARLERYRWPTQPLS